MSAWGDTADTYHDITDQLYVTSDWTILIFYPTLNAFSGVEAFLKMPKLVILL